MLRFGWWKFIAAVALGALIYVGMCLAIGYVFGEAIFALLGGLVHPLGVLKRVMGSAFCCSGSCVPDAPTHHHPLLPPPWSLRTGYAPAR